MHERLLFNLMIRKIIQSIFIGLLVVMLVLISWTFLFENSAQQDLEITSKGTTVMKTEVMAGPVPNDSNPTAQGVTTDSLEESSPTIPEVPRYGVFEVSLTASGNYENPYLEMPDDNDTPGFVTGEFRGPNNETITMDGFWDGGKTWKIRVSPTSEGTWSYKTFSSDSGLNGKSGSLISVKSNSNGFLRVDSNNPHHFSWTDGSPFYWSSAAIMISHFDEVGRGAQGGHSRVDDSSFQKFLDVRASQGFNITHWGFYGFNKAQFNDKTQRNEGGPPFVDYDPDRLNPDYYKYGDQRMNAVIKRGIVPELTLGWPDQGIVENIGHPRLKRYWRYLIARYSAYNIIYNLFGEVQEFGLDYLSIANDYGELTRRWDPYEHLISTHTVSTGVDSTLANLPWLDFITLQQSTQDTSQYLKYNKPVINAEFGGYEKLQVDGDALRGKIWDILMRGGYFVYESWGDDLASSGAAYASLANKFFREKTDFWLLEFHPELFNGRPGLANPGNEYVVYQPTGIGPVKINLTSISRPLSVSWYNPRTGESIQTPVINGGKILAFSSPTNEDWVLHLYSTCANGGTLRKTESIISDNLFTEGNSFLIFLPTIQSKC